ncbi:MULTISPECIES: hypothetical protein [unclassified Brevundimonas]|uniref:hypothetical protein n=1 Tax=unclassified Brevundimonas TaxID=2622653 RepID=UPI0025BBC748|nr:MULTISPECIES: hypothetical protein [unclassified Brevundimonas]
MSAALDYIFESENIVAKAVTTANTEAWVVTFDNYSIGHGFNRKGFGEDFFIENGVSAIHVMGKREDWYQYEEINHALAAVKEYVSSADRVMAYGSSMGGYAAIRFAEKCGAHIALAISPQYSIDPKKVPFEKRWLSDSRRIRFLRKVDGPIRSNIQTIIVYDPLSQDKHHVSLIKKEIDALCLALPFTGHPATTFLSEIGLLKELVFSAIQGNLDARQFKLKAREARSHSSLYYTTASERFLQRDIKKAVHFAKLAVGANPHSPLAYLSLALAQARSGAMNEALVASERMVEISNKDTNFLIHRANVLIQADQHEAALQIAKEVLADPNSQTMAHLHAWLAIFAKRNGDEDLYEKCMASARSLDPNEPRYRAPHSNNIRRALTFLRQTINVNRRRLLRLSKFWRY